MPFGQKFTSYLGKNPLGSMKNFMGAASNIYGSVKNTIGKFDDIVRRGMGVYNTVAPAIKDIVPEQMKAGLDKIDSKVAQGVNTYDKIRGRIDQAEEKLLSGAGTAMSKVNEVNRKLQGQGIDFSKLIA